MDYIVVGTAGHIDHGKTSLIKALTNMEHLKGKGSSLDRLKEEREREMTIDLGFACVYLPGGRCAEIIDVPGHEGFIKNMLAGASTIDLAILVIAANEGIMPQTSEHLDILKLLDIKKGLVVVTKVDIAEPDYLLLVVEDIRQTVQGTFLENAPVVQASIVTGRGLDELVLTLDQLTREMPPKDTTLPMRLFIDRVFTRTGFGTVITGTLVSGILKTGDPIEILPQRISGRVRQIENHGELVTQAKAGQRLGINLTGIKRTDLIRGNCLVAPGYLTSTTMFDGTVNLLTNCPRPLNNNTRVRLHLGSGEFLGRVALLDKDRINPGEKGLFQFRSESPLAITKNDRFVMRFYAPPATIGGGQVIDPRPVRHKRLQKEVIDYLTRSETATPAEAIEQILRHTPGNVLEIKHLARKTGLPLPMIESILKKLVSANTLVRSASGSFLMHQQNFSAFKERILEALNGLHQKEPLRLNITTQEVRLRTVAEPGIEWFFNQALSELASEGRIRMVVPTGRQAHNLVRLAQHTIRLSDEQTRLKERIEHVYLKERLAPPSAGEVSRSLGIKPASAQETIKVLVELGRLVNLPEDIIIHQQALDEAAALIKDYLAKNRQMRVGEFTKLLNTSRKYAVPMLEYFDSVKLTKRQGDFRVAGDKKTS